MPSDVTRRRGRPKTAVGHADDAATALLDARLALNHLRRMMAIHIREQHRVIVDINRHLVDADHSFRTARDLDEASDAPVVELHPVAA